MGYSQGVSAITRWIARSKISCDKLLLHSGGLPDELDKTDFSHIPNCKVILTYGDKDEHLSGFRLINEEKKYASIWGSQLIIKKFNGLHEVNEHIIESEAHFF